MVGFLESLVQKKDVFHASNGWFSKVTGSKNGRFSRVTGSEMVGFHELVVQKLEIDCFLSRWFRNYWFSKVTGSEISNFQELLVENWLVSRSR